MWYRIVPTSHIARQAERDISVAFEAFHPDVIAVELDRHRLAALLHGGKPDRSPRLIRVIGLRGYLFALVGSWLQQRLGRMVNMLPGSDMLTAVKLAQQEQKRLLLIDQHVQITLRRLNKAMGWQELKQFLKDGLRGMFGREKMRFDLRKTPSPALVSKLLVHFRERYPRPYRVLVEERNHFMANVLRKYHEQHPEERLLVVIGAGHREGMEELLSSQR